MAQATPELSDARKSAVKMGYRVTVLLAAFLLIAVLTIPDLESSKWIPFVPPLLGVLVYYYIR